MTAFYLDASAWVKYYTVEVGSDWMNQFWQTRPVLACSHLGPIEVVAALVRRGRQRNVDAAAISQLTAEVDRQYSGFHGIPISDPVLALARKAVTDHALRGADAIHFGSIVYLQQILGEMPTLIAADEELLKAATTQGLPVIDPSKNPPLPNSP